MTEVFNTGLIINWILSFLIYLDHLELQGLYDT